MTKSKRVMRRLILSKLYDHLQDQFTDIYPREAFVKGDLSIHELDGLLAFKSDAHLEELRCALDRLEGGTFGVCISCKSLISQDILDGDPTQRVCSTCEEKFIHFNSLGSLRHHLTT
jgi:RNA polymerase-binding transcription factor DksA